MKVPLSDIADLLDQKGAPILIIDEDFLHQEEIAKALIKENYRVLLAASPEEAGQILEKNIISIVIAYHKINGTSGLDFLTKAKQLYPFIERILIGFEPLPDHILHLLQPVQVLIHPISPQMLLATVQDRFNFFKLRYEHSLLNEQFLNSSSMLNDATKSISRELVLGKQIHKALLIDTPPKEEISGVSLTVSSHPSNSLDGDFVSFFKLSSHLFDVVIGDVMGKGLASVLVAMAVKGEISRFAKSDEERSLVFDHHHFWMENLPSIKEIIQQFHRSYIEHLLKLEYYVSLFYGRFDLDKRTLTFIDCGFTKPLYFRKASKKAVFIKSAHFPIGTVMRHEYFPFEVHFDKGDFFALYSDGIIEAASPKGELFGEKKLAQIIEHYHELGTEELAEKVKQAVIAFTEKEILEDDFTLLIVKIDQFLAVEPSRSGVAKFNSVLHQLEAVRKFTKELCCRAPGNMERLSTELQLAVDEVFTNIVIHGYDKKSGSPICISRVYLPDQIVIEISDQGASFNPFDIPPINLFGDQDHGYGWHLIRQISDRVVYTPKKTQNGWNHLSIFKNYYTQRTNVMEFTPIEQNGVLIIQLDSETLDAKQVPEFKEQVIQVLDSKGSNHVVFDLHKLQFIDSSGLGAFLSLFRYLNMKGGHLSLVAMSKSVKSIFELVSMQKIFDCHETIDLAVASKGKNK